MDRVRGRIVVVSAAVGAGHDSTTRELAARLTRRGFTVEQHDFMRLLPGRTGKRSLRAHSTLLRRAPWVYGALFGLGHRVALTAPLTRAMLYPVRARVLALLGPDVRAVVSTYPLASQVLSALRTTGRLPLPAVTYATDFAVHRHWVAPGIDAHLTPHPVGAAQARALGGRGVRVAGAVVRPEFHPTDPAGVRAARAVFGLPAGRLALIVAGSWGVGELEATAAEIAATGVAEPIVACGRNAALRARLRARGIRYALEWTDDMPTLMRAVDVVVENAGGQMALESMASGVPVLTYRPIPGHGRLNAAALARAGISTWVRHPAHLRPALIALIDGARGARQRAAAAQLFSTDGAEPIAHLAGRDHQPGPQSQITVRSGRSPRRGTLVAATAAVAFGVVAYLFRRPTNRA